MEGKTTSLAIFGAVIYLTLKILTITFNVFVIFWTNFYAPAIDSFKLECLNKETKVTSPKIVKLMFKLASPVYFIQMANLKQLRKFL